ncbi:hypothetical protein BC939DRAFT_477848 [Gamsiella multidivaricata]|uniref:uncharacterized protein n=1 Tax=Gamsiella multidivaricata TaxID=101098 RepID=UPI0022207101|nr:uncharacterized protein BC939DRAFT_477848 [Gamsiella multidivaricata]KAG0368970.1 hypothetical protein BGZ54_000717 [Gamsiella multidivaricata]KAI7822389.1 hypothetical protein BC939DRAFT_477848 [Gamsiella multidivaricata]
METQTVILPPRTRLLDLKSSADFPSEEFNHSIKTWVNMASLLVKQGNMAESNKDDENAYISYVRACLIITKIIPHQALYPTMMNDIVCIDLRQKILITIARMGHLERRLLKRFEKENQERVADMEKNPTSISVTASIPPPPTSSKKPSRRSDRKVNRTLQCGISVAAFDQAGQEEAPFHRTSFRQGDDDEDEGANADTEDLAEMSYEAPTSEIAFGLDPQIYVTHHHHRRSVTCGARSTSPKNPQQHTDRSQDPGEFPALRKKSSNGDDRSLLSPECQPNFAAMPSTLFARQREGGHVRRCSSTDAIRTSTHFPAAYPVMAPAIPKRSEKRASMWASVATDRPNSKQDMPEYRATASSVEAQENGGNGNREKSADAREVHKSRFSNRQTMSFESSYFNSNMAASDTAVPKVSSSQLRKSYSISRINMIRSKANLPPTPRLSVENLKAAVDGTLSSSSLNSSSSSNTNMSLSSASLTSTSQSSFSSACSTPSASPQLKPGPRMVSGHGHSHSLTSIPSGSCSTMADPTCYSNGTTSPSRPPFSSSSTNSLSLSSAAVATAASTANTLNMSTPQPTIVAPQPQRKQTPSVSYSNSSTLTGTMSATPSSSVSASPCSLSSSPTLTSISTWSTATVKKAGLLRKIRSRPKMKDQVFDIVATPSPVPTITPSHTPPPRLQHQNQRQGSAQGNAAMA